MAVGNRNAQESTDVAVNVCAVWRDDVATPSSVVFTGISHTNERTSSFRNAFQICKFERLVSGMWVRLTKSPCKGKGEIGKLGFEYTFIKGIDNK
jgi:hypothetical protein